MCVLFFVCFFLFVLLFCYCCFLFSVVEVFFFFLFSEKMKALTHICLIDYAILINWTSPFPILGVLLWCTFSFLFDFK